MTRTQRPLGPLARLRWLEHRLELARALLAMRRSGATGHARRSLENIDGQLVKLRGGLLALRAELLRPQAGDN
jgi:hypothetical protein